MRIGFNANKGDLRTSLGLDPGDKGDCGGDSAGSAGQDCGVARRSFARGVEVMM